MKDLKTEDIKDLGFKTNIEVIQSHVALAGKRLVDVGCGAMAFSLQLAEHAGHVLAIDPDAVQAKKNRNAELPPNVEFREAGADQFPASDNSIDGVVFAYSLHHVPSEIYPAVYREIQRVLKPDGFLYVIEPIDCPWNKVMQLFHDEQVVRAAAQRSLVELAVPMFESAVEFTYHGYSQYESFEEYADFFCAKAFNTTYSESDVRSPEVRQAFELHGAPDYRFQSPKRVMYLQNLLTE